VPAGPSRWLPRRADPATDGGLAYDTAPYWQAAGNVLNGHELYARHRLGPRRV